MVFIMIIYKYCLNFLYFFFKLLPTKNQVVIVSRQSNKKSIDIAHLEYELNKNNVKTVVMCKKIEDGLFNKIVYFFYIFKIMFYVAQSKVVVLDSYSIPISLLHHKKELYIIQMWHAIGILKKFGYTILNQKEGRSLKIAKVMNMHKNYNCVLASSEICVDGISQAYNVSPDKVKVIPLPRVDLLRSKEYIKETSKAIFRVYPQFKNKKNIVYVPTFRMDNSIMNSKINDLIKSVDFDKYNLIIKLHPNDSIIIKNSKAIIDYKFTSFEMLCIADFIISDYSSIIFEACILKKPIIFYAFDLDEYISNRGFFIDYKNEMPGIIASDSKEVVKGIESNKYDYKKQTLFLKKYVNLNSKSATKNLVSLIKKHL